MQKVHNQVKPLLLNKAKTFFYIKRQIRFWVTVNVALFDVSFFVLLRGIRPKVTFCLARRSSVMMTTLFIYLSLSLHS